MAIAKRYSIMKYNNKEQQNEIDATASAPKKPENKYLYSIKKQ